MRPARELSPSGRSPVARAATRSSGGASSSRSTRGKREGPGDHPGRPISSGLYKTVILDELNPTVGTWSCCRWSRSATPCCAKATETEVIITGRCKSRPAYFDLASVHSEMVCHKHYAERGVDLKRGVAGRDCRPALGQSPAGRA